MRITLWLLCVCTARVWCQSSISPAITPTSAPTINPTTITTAAPTTTPRPPPSDVTKVDVKTRNETHIELEWTKVDNINTYILKSSDETETPINGSDGNKVTHTVSSLSAGTEYSFTLFTVFEEVRSTGYIFSAVTAPRAVTEVIVKTRSETDIELEWTKVNNILHTYILILDGKETLIPGSDENIVTHTVSSLSAGTKYSFTLVTVFEGVKSAGYEFSAVTAPRAVTQVDVKTRSETHIELEWTKVNNILHTYILILDGKETLIPGSDENIVTHTVSSLSAGTKYSFTLVTVFEGVKSAGYEFSAVTAPRAVTEVIVKTRSETDIELEWTKVISINTYTYILKSNETETPITGSDGNKVTHTVSSLSAGTKYSFTLFTVFDEVRSTGYIFSAVTVPSDVDDVTDKKSFETRLVLQWTNVNNDTSYNYTLRDSDGNNTFIPGSNGGNTVTHTVPSLSPGTKYTFTLFTVFEGVQSKGFNFSEATVPSAAEVMVTNRAETELTLQWSTVNSTDYILLDSSGENITFSGPLERTMTQTVSSLSPGTEYSFTLRTIFETKANEYDFSSVTTIDCAASKWTITNFTIKAEVVGLFSMAAATNGTNVTGTVGENKVSFTDLYPGATYNVSLFYQLKQQDLLQCSHSLTLIPAVVTSLHCERGDYSVRLKWEKPFGVWTEVEVNVSGRGSESVSGTELIVSGLQPAQTYSINVASLSGAMRSSPEGISCHTHSTVIWLPVLLIILMGLLTALGVFMLRRKPELLSKVHMPMSKRPTEMQSSQGKFEAIPVKTFSEHFHHMTRDENRELTAEYMGFNTAGADQTQREATLSENMSKNRFTDILPYDSSRVRLNTRGHDSDYINANYIPGYGRKNKEYIATQGPLPSTVSDFWRMIWEQKSGQIVMVTNCIENGKTKCEKYWPQDHTPCRYDDLLITMKSEHKETYWTTREFIVKNEASSEERVIKQFHFTAWPDHGVPYGTETLIQFRGLIRHHIDNSQNPGPTVTHCSAGVGRTGTLIALDVLLQQLEREKAVDIAGFVHSMRCRRPRMVQTESQYLFLHQCIKDHLTEKPVEPLYANAVIYENEEALKQYRSDQIAGR